MDCIEPPTSWFLIGQVFALAGLAYLGKITFNMPMAGWSSLRNVLRPGSRRLPCHWRNRYHTARCYGPNHTTHGGRSASGQCNHNSDERQRGFRCSDFVCGSVDGFEERLPVGGKSPAPVSGPVLRDFCRHDHDRLCFHSAGAERRRPRVGPIPCPVSSKLAGGRSGHEQRDADLHSVKRWSIAVGAAVGIALAVLPALFPKKTKYIPSAAGVGLAWTFHWYYSLLFFIGAFGAWLWKRKNAENAEEFTYPVASGIIAGGSLMGVFLILWENGPDSAEDASEAVRSVT